MNRRKGPAGRPIRVGRLPRRFILVICIAVTFVLLLILANPSHRIPTSSSELRKSAEHGGRHAKDFIRNPNIPALYNPFADTAHEPPDQAGSKSGDTRWYNDWRWLRPFSSQVTLHDDRALLPPLPDRPRIYTYYDAAGKAGKVKDAEYQLLLTWRRAWWAKGFKPIVLGRAEAQKSEAWWQRLQGLEMAASLKQEFERLLAWHYIGGGILVDWLLVPMSGHDDATMIHLRRGDYKGIMQFKSLGTGFLGGRDSDIGSAINAAFGKQQISDTNDIFKLMEGVEFTTDDKHAGLAYYDSPTILSRYPNLGDEISSSRAGGLESLNKLINAHLAHTWQAQFSSGIAILKPQAAHTTILSNFATHIAQTLSLCQKSPLPKSCPPNIPRCKPCDVDQPLPLSLPSTYSNASGLFTLGTVPHPLTMTALLHTENKLTTPFIRRNTARDAWLRATTSTLLGTGINGPQRLVGFKEAVAGGAITDPGDSKTVNASWRGIWFTAEREDPVELEWMLGFALPEPRAMEDAVALQLRLQREEEARVATKPGQLAGEPGAGRDPQILPEQLKTEKSLMSSTRAVVYGKGKKEKATREVVEAWNLADTEAWRFVRALGMRRHMERMGWEEEERGFAGSRSG